jgi:hypothetical protein
MGCDIHSFAEKKDEDGNWEVLPDFEPFEVRSYRVYGWLANVRNYSALTPIAERRGFPEDASPDVKEDYESWDCNAHSASWLSLEELLSFNYDATCEDRRVTREISPNFFDGGQTCEAGEGTQTTYREFFGDYFFKDLEKLKELGAERVVFWFDN